MYKHFVKNEEVSYEKFNEELEDAIRANVEDHYDDMLDECYDEVKIGCCTFTASEILKNCDPIAYRCGINDFVDADLSDAQSNFEDEYEDTINGIEFRTEEVEDEDNEDEDEDEECYCSEMLKKSKEFLEIAEQLSDIAIKLSKI